MNSMIALAMTAGDKPYYGGYFFFGFVIYALIALAMTNSRKRAVALSGAVMIAMPFVAFFVLMALNSSHHQLVSNILDIVIGECPAGGAGC